MNRAQTCPEPGTLLDARVNTVFSASPILWSMVMPQSVMAHPTERKDVYQGVDIPGPKCPKGSLSVEVTSKPSLSSFSDCALIQSREGEHVQPFALPLFGNIVCICFQREVLLCLPNVNETQSVDRNGVPPGGGKDNGYM
jgi:hypothetical protein